jgi:tetrahydromethanopterin S-methyltransferase subunit H
MFNFSHEQTVVEIGGVRMGGQPGETPTVLLGTLFYAGQFATYDDEARRTIESQVRTLVDLWDETGNPGLVDLFVARREHLERNVDALLEVADWHSPFSLDVPESSVRTEALAYLDEAGLSDRVILNSVNLGITDPERQALADHPPAGAIVLGYNPKNTNTDGRLRILRDGDGMVEGGLLDLARSACGDNLLLDTAATPFGNGAGENLRSVPVFKNAFGLPTGLAIHNTVESWRYIRNRRKTDPAAYERCDMAANALPPLLGADWLIFGPLDNAPKVYPVIAMVDTFVSEAAEDYFSVAPGDDHPRRRLAP